MLRTNAFLLGISLPVANTFSNSDNADDVSILVLSKIEEVSKEIKELRRSTTISLLACGSMRGRVFLIPGLSTGWMGR